MLKLLNYMDRPIVFVNSNEYWSGLLAFFDRMIEERFAVPDNRHLYHVVNDPHAALDYIATYYPEPQAEPVVGDEEARRTALE